MIRTRCHTWSELAHAGLDRPQALAAVGDLVGAGQHRVLLGPVVVGLEHRPDCLALVPPARRRGTVDPADLLAELEDGLLARISIDPAIGHTVAGQLGDHLLTICEELRQRHGLAAEASL